jgi:hypothetical protein
MENAGPLNERMRIQVEAAQLAANDSGQPHDRLLRSMLSRTASKP